MRIFTISDLHVDFSENYRWLTQLSIHDYTQDILILAGDVSDNRPLLAKTFKILTDRFRQVFFVPGNHDLWVFRNKVGNSLDSYLDIKKIAVENGIRVSTAIIGTTAIVPLLGWYDYSFGAPSREILKSWVDFKACKWPPGFTLQNVADHFAALNEENLTVSGARIITFSHFLPRIDLMPKFVTARTKLLFPVLGTTLLEQQIRKIMPQIHIYGHSHLNRNVKLGNIHYINNAFGYPYEARIAAKELLCIGEI